MWQFLEEIAVSDQKLVLEGYEGVAIAIRTCQRSSIEQLEHHYAQRPDIDLPTLTQFWYSLEVLSVEGLALLEEDEIENFRGCVKAYLHF